MGILEVLWSYVVPFLVILTVVVFVHELGHYLIARRNGVRVEVFSIGFGPEIFGWTDRAATRWKVAWVPLGGYVKFFGDSNAASTPDGSIATMTDAERAISFHHKRLSQRAAIVVAGPLANFVFAVLVYAVLFIAIGQPYSPAVIDQVVEGSAADDAGFQPGDRIISIDGGTIGRFQEVQQIVRLSPGRALDVIVMRDGNEVSMRVTPQLREFTDNFGRQHRIGLLGVSRAGGVELIRHDPATALALAVLETAWITEMTLNYVGQVIVGARGGDEIGGPIGIARMSGEVFQISFAAVLSFLAVLSISLGLLNLFPIPLLDGGHLLFYFIEAVRGKPLGEKSQEYGFRIGLALVLSLMVFATWNDLSNIPQVVNFLSGVFS